MAKHGPATTDDIVPEPPTSGGVENAEYTVVARRYRPQQFTQLVGQDAVARSLANAIQNDRVAHAYLFTGARGVGKTSTARILAKCLNCAEGPTISPCDRCPMCVAITAGEDIDVQEIDGASNRGIDEIRAIRQNVAVRPAQSRYKIYIIDEVHMLTGPAFNALLKTLEEPPPHVKFIFATTEVQKIPITILSRCQRFDFGTITPARILNRLQEIVAAEGMNAEIDALKLVAQRAHGSMRDAQSLLEQLLAAGDGQLTVELIHSLLGTATDDRVVAIADGILNHNPATGLQLIAQAAEDGLQMGELLDQLIEYWRYLMLIQATNGQFRDFQLTVEASEQVVAHAQMTTLDTVLAGLEILTSAKNRMKLTGQHQVVLEMTVVRLCRLEEMLSVSQIIQWLKQGGASSAGNLSNLPTRAGAVENLKKNSLTAKNQGIPTPTEKISSNGLNPSEKVELNDATLNRVWSSVKSQAGIMHGGELGKAASIAIRGPNTLVLTFSAHYNHSYDYCSDPKRVAKVEEHLRTLTGSSWNFRLERDQSAGPETARTPSAGEEARSHQEKVKQIPLVKGLLEVLEARLLKVDDEFGSAVATVVDDGDGVSLTGEGASDLENEETMSEGDPFIE
ncbi:MAG: DNA polymerase III subunit gamma/tau [Zavarzinella sp.]